MCGRFYIAAEDMTEDIARILAQLDAPRHAAGDVRPTDRAPVITARGACAMQWGFTLPGRASPVINARSETADIRPLFAPSVQWRRCLVPASGYYEWDAARCKHRITRREPLLMAGIYRPEDDRQTRFCILTRAAAPAISSVHHRMPLLLPGTLAAAWLGGELPLADAAAHALEDVSARADIQQLSMF